VFTQELTGNYTSSTLYPTQKYHGIFNPTGSPTSDKFISSLSVALLVIFFLMLRSSASPFLNPMGEARKAASSSFYFSLSFFLYTWVISSTVLTIIPHFSSHYNGVIAAALFFPMFFSSIVALLFGRLIIRSIFYCLVRSGIYQSRERIESTDDNSWSQSIGYLKPPKMVAFHRPFRKLAKSAALLSISLSLLHAHCWSRTLSVFKINKRNNAGAICRALFSPFATNEDGADEQTIWILWIITLSMMLVVFAQDELNGYHCRSDNAGFTIHFRKTKSRRKSSITDDDLDMDCNRSRSKNQSNESSTRMIFRRANQLEVPRDTLPMVPWLSLFAAHSVLDIFISLKVFMGRVDARLMHPALQGQKHSGMLQNKNKDTKSKVHSSVVKYLQEKYPGCIYDYSTSEKKDLWFDFMADCGDGFNSSYQVARLLAQRHITVTRNGKEHRLPRGDFLVIGGDLAYPEPTEASYEKRFFRTFEDAMSPPPSFRRNKIATNKLDICVDGWDEKLCFNGTVGEHSHEKYLGPSTFVVPGNHDWYDGLATYSRFILHRDFLGGWLMPQQRSYFAIKLPGGWWILGMDCALSADIDIEQFKFFADIADTAVGPSDAVILVNHEPHWVTDFDNGKKGDNLSERNITELTEIHLRGKVRCRLAGDLHHYTRHVPLSRRKKAQSQRRVRSYSLDRMSKKIVSGDFKRKPDNFEPFTEDNKPHLIVSGGGGAFLHGTNTFDRDIKVGPKGIEYTRVVAYPNEATSTCLGWLNMYQFRWRGWRCDLIFAVTYLGIVSSFFPLCGIYEDYEQFNPNHELRLLFVWLARMVVSLVLRMISSEWYSLICFLGVLLMMIALQAPEHHIKPLQRYTLAFGHAFAHITAAITCLVFVQYVAEWAIKESIISLNSIERSPLTPNPNSLAGSIYGEYKTHFYPALRNFTHTDSSLLQGPFRNEFISYTASLIKVLIDFGNSCWDFLFSNVPLLKTTLKLFDLPSLVAQNHHEMCSQLCINGKECLFSHDSTIFQRISRKIFAPYVTGVTLYYIFIAVPLAGTIFGTWLAISLNVFKSMCDLAFSSLQIQHYKNFVKLHVNKDGELEVYAIGMRKVPTSWVKDPFFEGDCSQQKNLSVQPSWTFQCPSKWIPANSQNKAFNPHVIDHCTIPKRRIKGS